jgi:hypothetical protein
MRLLAVIAVFGGFLSVRVLQAQPDAGKQAQPKANVKQAKPGQRHHRALTVGEATELTVAEQRAIEGDGDDEAAPETAAAPRAAAPAPLIPTVQAAPPGPPQKRLTGREFALLHAGFTTQEVLAVLGPPASRIVIPDDDDHLRETLQYWVNGVPAATIRLDNGRVIQIETKPK